MQLTDVDLDLLELTALQVPWYMVCGEFHGRYGSPGALAARLFELREQGLISIRAREGAALDPAALVADAIEHRCYEDLESTREPLWSIVSTDSGFAAVKSRLSAQ